MSVDAVLYGTDLLGDPVTTKKAGPLAERFEFPPFTVLSARDGDWQERKRAWLALGIKSEMGRGDNLTYGDPELGDLDLYRNKNKANAAPGGSAMPATDYSKTRARGDGAGRSQFGKCLETGIGEAYGRKEMNATSIFDPVLCELAYRWFCPPGGQIVDPFAGGSVRGLIAGLLGYRYHGIDLRAEQVVANRAQLAAIAPEAHVRWLCGDSIEFMEGAPPADFIFSCPPYGDLEVYSDDPRDLSTMEYHTFLAAYKRIILRCAERLKDNRMACFVVGDFRDKRTGMYRGFVADTINAFRECGMQLYNDAVLVTAVGSLPVRVSSQFAGSRKLGKTHQNVLVFAKGDPKLAFAQ